jgi:hypothetical protein
MTILYSTSPEGKGPQANHLPPPEQPAVLAAALAYLERGFAIVPQKAGDKKPSVRWKPFQQRLPTREEGIGWFIQQFPDAGIAVVLGPVSNLFVIDVDGPEAHEELDGAEAGGVEARVLGGEVIVEVRGCEHGSALVVPLPFPKTTLDAALAITEPAFYLGLHLKYLHPWEKDCSVKLSISREMPR